mgnify:CR=1 FL=1
MEREKEQKKIRVSLKINERDAKALRAQARSLGVCYTSLIRIAIRQFLQPGADNVSRPE